MIYILPVYDTACYSNNQRLIRYFNPDTIVDDIMEQFGNVQFWGINNRQ